MKKIAVCLLFVFVLVGAAACTPEPAIQPEPEVTESRFKDWIGQFEFKYVEDITVPEEIRKTKENVIWVYRSDEKYVKYSKPEIEIELNSGTVLKGYINDYDGTFLTLYTDFFCKFAQTAGDGIKTYHYIDANLEANYTFKVAYIRVDDISMYR